SRDDRLALRVTEGLHRVLTSRAISIRRRVRRMKCKSLLRLLAGLLGVVQRADERGSSVTRLRRQPRQALLSKQRNKWLSSVALPNRILGEAWPSAARM